MAHNTPGNNVAEIPNREQTARKALRSSMDSPQENGFEMAGHYSCSEDIC
jgi:hypothetical protein